MSMHEKSDREKNIEPRLGDDIPENWIKQATNEMNAETRTINVAEFRGEENVDLIIYHPTPGDDSFASDIYSRMFSKHIQDPELLTRKQMEKLLLDRGLWGEEHENKIKDLQEDMRVIEISVAKLRKRKQYNVATLNKHRMNWTAKKEQIGELINEKQQFLSNTVEGRAEEEQLKAKLSRCVKFAKDDVLVWDSLESINKEKEKRVVNTLIHHAIFFWSGFTQEIIDQLPADLIFGRGEESAT